MSVIIHGGFDPATQLLGWCLIDNRGNPLPSVEAFHCYKLFSANGEIYDRLEVLEHDIAHYLRTDLPRYLDRLYGVNSWRLSSITVENPASGNKGYQNQGKSRHDTTLALGGAFYMLMSVLRKYCRETQSPIYLFESKASEATSQLRLHTTANKKARNYQSAVVADGRFHVEDEKHPEKGYVVGGNLAGAGPDVLDAFGAALVGLSRFTIAELSETGKKQRGKPVYGKVQR